MKSFKTFVTESKIPEYGDLLNQAKHHAQQEQYVSNVASAHTPGGRDVTAHESVDHTHKKIEVFNKIAKHYPDKLSHAMGAVERHVSGN